MKIYLIILMLFISISLSALNLEKIVRESIIKNKYPQKELIIDKIFYYADLYGVDPYLAIALAYNESSFRQYAYNTRNKNGSIDRGVFQLNSYSYPKMKREDFYNLDKNIITGIKHIKYAIKKGGSEYAGLSIYNCGRVKNKSIYAEKILKTKNYLVGLFDAFVKRVENSKLFSYVLLLDKASYGALEKSAFIFCRQEDLENVI